MDHPARTPISDSERADSARAASAAPPQPPNSDNITEAKPDRPGARPTEEAGDMIGPYLLLGILGEGGFGTVWQAERREPFVQRVALKIIKAGMDTRSVIARFEQERQALAVMDHPSVAKVHDAGTTDNGRPYFVMELVAGEPITVYCDKHRLTLRQRLELFIPACDAVQHAHHKGIIHRDIKPSNILVAVRDAQAVPKVIDFGVAKAVSHTLTDKTIFTETGQMIGTPEYMSPEQAEMRGGDIDTRSDVYSLGAVLYELLTGRQPFESSALRRAGYSEIQRVIREVEPPKPSTLLTSLGADARAEIAQFRRIERDELASELRRELDWIPLKALRKDRTERYSSPADLARDIRNYLEGRPLEAGPESTTYRLRKLIRRNKGIFAAAAAIAATLVLGLVGFAWQARRVGIERDATAVERDRAVAAETTAKAERDRATSIKDFLVQTLQSADPSQEGKQDIRVSDAILKGTQQLSGSALDDQPATKAQILSASAEILRSNGQSAAALPLAEQSLAITQRLHPGDHPDVAIALNNLAIVREAVGRAIEAEPLFVQALEMNQRLFPGDHLAVADSLSSLAGTLQILGRSSQAEPLLVQALEMRQRLLSGDRPEIAKNLGDLARVRMALNRLVEAEALHVQSLEMFQRYYKTGGRSGDHPEVAVALNNLALVRQHLGRIADAERVYVQALEMNQRLFKGDHPDIATALNNLAGVRDTLYGSAQAEPLYAQVLQMRQRIFKSDHASVATAMNNLAYVWQSQGRKEDAAQLYQQAMEMHQRLFKGDHPSVAMSMCNLARARHDLGQSAESRRLFDECIAMFRRLSPTGSPALARVLWRSACASLDSNPPDTASAMPQLEEAVTMAERFLPPEHPHLKDYRDTLAECRVASRK